MECRHCQSAVPDGSQFCNHCGNKIEACSSPIPLPAEETVRAGTRTEGERKHATILFSDLSGYTSQVENLDPEEVKALMGLIFAEAGKIVEKYEGTVERFFGDEVMAVFGVPLAHEDDPVRAIRAALEIHTAVSSISPKYETQIGRPLSMHTGINTGLVITGDERIGKGRHGLTGDAINLAKRLTGLGKAGEIIVGADTHRQAGRLFDFEKMLPVQVKGKADPIQVYRLMAKSGTGSGNIHCPRFGSERQVYSPMVGRDRELKSLEDSAIWLRDGHGSIVNVVGEAGIGKSRLIAEFKKSKVLEKVVLLEGRAISIGRNLSFHPIIDLLRNWARIGESDTPQIALGKLNRSVRTIAAEKADEIFPFVATLMGMKLSGKFAQRVKGIEGEALERLILKNVRDLVKEAARRTPVAFVLEDLHWADSSSIELLSSLYRLSATMPILFINVFRPGHEETSERIVSFSNKKHSSNSLRISIGPLDAFASETIIGNMLNIHGLPVSIKKLIVERASGNPFFIEEVVRSLIDTGAIVYRNGRFEVTRRIDTVEVPGTIQDVLLARIDRLEAQTRNLVKIASVIGRNFFRKILLEVAQTISEIDRQLDHLKDIQLIRERQRMEEIEYIFKHALAQEAAYSSILHQNRKKIHLDVAQAIEHVFRERLHEFYGVLALHYSVGEEPSKAEDYLFKAGEEALKSSASSEALGYFRKALESYVRTHGDRADMNRVTMMERNIALSLHNKGNILEALPYFDRLIRRYGEPIPSNIFLGMPKLLRCLFILLISLYLPSLRWKKTPSVQDLNLVGLFFKRQQMLIDIDSEKYFFHSLILLARISRYDPEKVNQSMEIFGGGSTLFSWTGLSYGLSRKILELQKRNYDNQNLSSVGFYHLYSSLHNYMAGTWSEEKKYDEGIFKHFIKIGEITWGSVYLVVKGHIVLEQGNLVLSEQLIHNLAQIADDYENDYARLQKHELSIKYSLKCRRLREANEEALEAVAFSKKIGLKLYIGFFSTLLARVMVLADDLEGAGNIINEFEDYFKKEVKEPYFLSWHALTKLYLSVGILKKAKGADDSKAVQEATKQCRLHGKRVKRLSRKIACDRVESLRLLGELWVLQGNPQKASSCWVQSIEAGETLCARPELARTFCEVGKHLLDTHSRYKQLNGITGQEYLEKARSSFEEMDLQWDLAELELVLSAS